MADAAMSVDSDIPVTVSPVVLTADSVPLGSASCNSLSTSRPISISGTAIKNVSTELLLYRPQPWFVPKCGYTVPTEKFHNFKGLPSEIGLDIWKLLLLVPRLIDIRVEGDFVKYFKTTCPPPAILCVSPESRAVGLRFYRSAGFIFRNTDDDSTITNLELAPEHRIRRPPPPQTRILLNFELDSVLVFPHVRLSPFRFTPDLETGINKHLVRDGSLDVRIRFLILGWYFPKHSDTTEEYYESLIGQIRNFPALEKVTVFLYQYHDFTPSDQDYRNFESTIRQAWHQATISDPTLTQPIVFEAKRPHQFPLDQRMHIVAAEREYKKRFELLFDHITRGFWIKQRMRNVVTESGLWHPGADPLGFDFEDRRQVLLPWHDEESRHEIMRLRPSLTFRFKHPANTIWQVPFRPEVATLLLSSYGSNWTYGIKALCGMECNHKELEKVQRVAFRYNREVQSWSSISDLGHATSKCYRSLPNLKEITLYVLSTSELRAGKYGLMPDNDMPGMALEVFDDMNAWRWICLHLWSFRRRVGVGMWDWKKPVFRLVVPKQPMTSAAGWGVKGAFGV